MSLIADVQGFDLGAVLDLFVLDATGVGGVVSRFHSGKNGLLADVVWQNQTYTAFPIEASGFEQTAQGALPRPMVRVANVNQLAGQLVRQYEDLVGAKFTRKRVLAKYLDAANFAGGNPSADPTAGFPDEVWYIDRKSAETRQVIEFELTAAWDVSGVMLPRRQFQANVCAWGYRSADCGYAGGAVAKIDDTPTSDINQDACGHRRASCLLRFPVPAALPFGGFPSADLLT